MSPLDCIAQLTNENAILRSQLRDAQEQAKRDSATIEKLGALCSKRDNQLFQIRRELSTLADKCTL